MTDVAIKANGLGKRYQLGALGSQHNSLRDALQAAARGMSGRKAADGGRKEFWALRNASFEIRRGENVGIVGLNGAGKSTLLKVLSQIVTPTDGTAEITGRLGALLEVGTGFHKELTGRENIFLYGSILGMRHDEVAAKFDQIVAFSEIEKFIDTPVKRYSSGMYVRLAFAVAAHLDPDILLLDEVLAVGDVGFQKKCMDFTRSLEKRGSTILFVSHNMFSIKSMCPRVIYLRKGEVVFDGPTEQGLGLYEKDSRLTQSHWYRHDGEGTPPITFTDIQLMDEQGVEKTVFNFGERMKVRLRYQTSRPIAYPDVRIGINRSDEIHCATFNTNADNVEIAELNGKGWIEMITPPMTFVAEMYFSTVSVREGGRSISSQIGAHFHISHPLFEPNSYGVVHEPGRWILSAEQPAAVAAVSQANPRR
jgi:lipopolysaccharide transport system ATP-binding protein